MATTTQKPKKISHADTLRKELEASPKPKVSEIGTEFIKLLGGTKNFAKAIHKEYIGAKIGSVIRGRTLTTILATLKTNEEEYTAEALQNLDDEDIDQLLRNTVARAYELGVLSVGTVQNPPDGNTAQPEEAGPEGEEGGAVEAVPGGDEEEPPCPRPSE